MKTATASAPKPSFSHQMADEEKSMPLGVGDMSPDDSSMDPLAGTTGESRRIRSGSMLIVVVVVIACGGLWFMRTLSHVSGATGAKSDVEKSIESFLGARDTKGNAKVVSGTDPSVLAVLSASYIDKHVPLESVQRNPFILPGENDTAINTTPIAGEDPAQAIARARGARQKEIDAAAAKLMVKSIIMSAQPLANLSGMIVRVGDEIAPEGSDITFRVQSITNDTVMLATDDIALGMHVEVPVSMRRDK